MRLSRSALPNYWLQFTGSHPFSVALSSSSRLKFFPFCQHKKLQVMKNSPVFFHLQMSKKVGFCVKMYDVSVLLSC
jgi:hypothetical protein